MTWIQLDVPRSIPPEGKDATRSLVSAALEAPVTTTWIRRVLLTPSDLPSSSPPLRPPVIGSIGRGEEKRAPGAIFNRTMGSTCTTRGFSWRLLSPSSLPINTPPLRPFFPSSSFLAFSTSPRSLALIPINTKSPLFRYSFFHSLISFFFLSVCFNLLLVLWFSFGSSSPIHCGSPNPSSIKVDVCVYHHLLLFFRE